MRYKVIFLTAILPLSYLFNGILSARPTTTYEAEKVVTGWLKADPQPLGAALGQRVANVETFTDEQGEPIYYIVYLDPSGFVIVPADDLVEPIIGFADDGIYDPSSDNPLGALVTRNVVGRLLAVRAAAHSGVPAAIQAALKRQSKWERLISLSEEAKVSVMMGASGLESISDICVEPLLQSKWWQETCCAPQGDPWGCFNIVRMINIIGVCALVEKLAG